MAEPSFRMTESLSRMKNTDPSNPKPSSPFTPILSSPSSKLSSKHSPSSFSPLQQTPTPVLPKSPLPKPNPPVSPPLATRTPYPSPAVATGYPSSHHQKPKPKPRGRNAYRSASRSSCSCCRVFCIVLLLLLLLFLLAFIVGAAGYLWFQPRPPVFELTSIQFPRFNVSVKPDGTYFDSGTVVDFKFKNRNEKISFNYGTTRVSLSVGDDISLGSTNIPEFTQPKKNTTLIKFETSVDHVEISGSDGLKLMDRFEAKSIPVSVDIQTKFGATLDCWNWKIRRVPVRVLCEDVKWKNSPAGATNNPKCTIIFLKWIRINP